MVLIARCSWTSPRCITPLIGTLDRWTTDARDGAVFTGNPQFLGSRIVGGADADWAIGGRLVELKSKEQITNPWIRDTLMQLIGYTLLDLDDSLRIREVTMLLPRQPYTQNWTLDLLLDEDAETALPEQRNGLAEILLSLDGK